MTWCTTELREAVHVHPFYESGHILGPWCWCEPREDDTEPKAILTHRDQLERAVQDA